VRHAPQNNTSESAAPGSHAWVEIQPSWILRQSYFQMDGHWPPVSNGMANILGDKIHACWPPDCWETETVSVAGKRCIEWQHFILTRMMRKGHLNSWTPGNHEERRIDSWQTDGCAIPRRAPCSMGFPHRCGTCRQRKEALLCRLHPSPHRAAVELGVAPSCHAVGISRLFAARPARGASGEILLTGKHCT
jgi:hypothetical protein